MLGQNYSKKIRDFKDKFAKARQTFNESLQMVIFDGVYSLGEWREYHHSWLGELTHHSFLRASEGT